MFKFSGNERHFNAFYESTLRKGIESDNLLQALEVVDFSNYFYTINSSKINESFGPVLAKFLKNRRFDTSLKTRKFLSSLHGVAKHMKREFVKIAMVMIKSTPEGGDLGLVGETLMLLVQEGAFKEENYVSASEKEKIRDMFTALQEQRIFQTDPTVLLRVISPEMLTGNENIGPIKSVLIDMLDSVDNPDIYEGLLLAMYSSSLNCISHTRWFEIRDYLEVKVLPAPSTHFIKELYRIAFKTCKNEDVDLGYIAPGDVRLPCHPWFDEEEFFSAILDKATLDEADLDLMVRFKKYIEERKEIEMTVEETVKFKELLIQKAITTGLQ